MIVLSVGPTDLIDLYRTDIADGTDSILKHLITFNEAYLNE